MDGLYGIEIPGEKFTFRSIHCRMSIVGGGWTVIQRRVYGTTEFDKYWDEYKEGFGDLSTDFWYGNEKIHQLAEPGTNNEVLFELEDINNDFYYPYYDEFNVGSEIDKYKLNVGQYKHVYGSPLPPHPLSRTNGKDFERDHGMSFSTRDSDNDISDQRHCSAEFYSGWWFHQCTWSNINGKFRQNANTGMKWEQITNAFSDTKSLQTTVMMIRKRKD